MAQENEFDSPMSTAEMAVRFVILAILSSTAASLSYFVWGLNSAQTISVTIFLVIILATLFFWSFRLAIAFLGLPVLILSGALELQCFREHCALEVMTTWPCCNCSTATPSRK